MNRAPHRRRLRLFALAFGLPVLVVAPWANAATAAAEVPTITFTATAAPPVACRTRPNVSSLSIKTGTDVAIANGTGVAATIYVDHEKLVDVGVGAGALVRLVEGQYELQMIPKCTVVIRADSLALNVVAAPQDVPPPSPSAGTEQPTGAVIALTTGAPAVTSPTGIGAPVRTGGTTRTTAAQPTATLAPAGAGQSASNAANPKVLKVDSYQVDGQRDPKGLRLLGAIATICLLGVTAAIIRAIVSERTRGPVV